MTKIKIATIAINYKSIGRSMPLAGFGSRTSDSPIGDPDLYLKLLVISMSNKYAIVATIDALYFPTFLEDAITRSWNVHCSGELIGIISSASHTHSAPDFNFFDRTLDLRPAIEAFHVLISEQFSRLRNDHFANVSVSYGKVPLCPEVSVSRRKAARLFGVLNFGIKNMPAPEKNIDDAISTIVFKKENDEVHSAVISYAAHPVFNTSNTRSSDFPGLLTKKIEALYPDSHILFCQGFGGDVRPYFTEHRLKYTGLKKVLIKWFIGRIFEKYTKSQFDDFVKNLSNAALKAIAEPSHEIPNCKKTVYFSEKTFGLRFNNSTRTEEMILTVLIIGGVSFVSINAEVFNSYSDIVNKALKSCFLCMSCSSHLVGYLPSSAEVLSGGYEVTTSNRNWGHPGEWERASIEEFEHALYIHLRDTLVAGAK